MDLYFFLLFPYYEFPSASFITCFSFSEITPNSISHVLWQSASESQQVEIFGGTVCLGFNISQPLFSFFNLSRSQPPHLCYGFTVTNEKSICPVGSDMVRGQRILASWSCFSVLSFNFQFTGGGGEGREGRLSFFLFFFHILTFTLFCSLL